MHRSNLRTQGFSLAELLLAILVTTVAILGIMALAISLLRGTQKTVDISAAQVAADHVMTTLIYQAQNDIPSGEHSALWDHNFTSAGPPYKSGTYTLNHTDFEYRIDAQDATDMGGTKVGTASGLSDNRLKVVQINMSWWGQKQGEREGYGKLQFSSIRLIHEQRAP